MSAMNARDNRVRSGEHGVYEIKDETLDGRMQSVVLLIHLPVLQNHHPSLNVAENSEIVEDNNVIEAPKREYQPKMIKRKRKHGFLSRIKTANGRRVLRNRLIKERKRLSKS